MIRLPALSPCIVASLALAAAPAAAEDPVAVGSALLHGELALSLEDAIAMGLENNLGVEIERFDPYIAEERAEGAWGAYDPEPFGDWDYASIDNPSANAKNKRPQSQKITMINSIEKKLIFP